uniref:Biotin carboxyl carrier protein of acetyl-CoA carboxylase n=1 Tax=Galaxaura rugosa TaxID=268570 RepID=A0A1G4NSZ8_9FLOR|nr:Acetyl-CoA carboxylase, biotin carboxyl carrier protein [Galaxaura rugosa]SCW21788.1 Acetyl-CoA carboxylase, biotin carboxyl carrier protein [Galaxaura rugosa]
MQFNLNDLKELLLCIKTNELQSMIIKKDKFELIINRKLLNTKPNYITTINPTNTNTQQRLSTKINNNTKDIIKNTEIKHRSKDKEIYFTIISPMVGTFYRSPSPSEPHFVEIHDYVKNDQTVCIVEAMKLMNEIEAEVNGEVVEILAKDGDIVDCGQPLMKIKPG